MAKATQTFPPDFLWGTATASHQVEGANNNNDWWQWEQQGGDRVFENHTSDDACEWWAGRAEEDIERMGALNTRAHRLSLEWSRIQPREDRWDTDALDRYRDILKAMNKAGVQPLVTLHHFTNPIWFAERGGWMNPNAPEMFRTYVERTVNYLADIVDVWCTINEPNVYAANSYFQGQWPPGMTDMNVYFRVVLNMLNAHAAAYKVIHEIQPNAKVGLAKHMIYWQPRGGFFSGVMSNLLDKAFNEITLTALDTGEWKPIVGKKAQLENVKGTLDWIGLNYYQRYDAWFNLRKLGSLGVDFAARPGAPKGPDAWGELYPEGLFLLIKRLYRQFKLPIHITENGVPDEDDSIRPGYLLQHLQQVWKAIMHNIPVQGYYFWSLLDNFEWAEGYDPRFRFGLYEVDFETQERTLRTSGELYAKIAEQFAISSDLAEEYAPHVLEELYPGKGPGDLSIV